MATHDQDNDPQMAEALARANESRAQVLRSKAARAGVLDQDGKGYAEMAREAAAEAEKSAKALGDIPEPEIDYEGTARPLADSEGNFAANVEVAATGGTGIKGSNSTGPDGGQATKPEDAGYAVTEGAATIKGDQVVEQKEVPAAPKPTASTKPAAPKAPGTK